MSQKNEDAEADAKSKMQKTNDILIQHYGGHEMALTGCCCPTKSIKHNGFDSLACKRVIDNNFLSMHEYNNILPIFSRSLGHGDLELYRLDCQSTDYSSSMTTSFVKNMDIFSSNAYEQDSKHVYTNLLSGYLSNLLFFIEHHETYGNVLIVIYFRGSQNNYHLYSFDTQEWLPSNINTDIFGLSGCGLPSGYLFDDKLLIVSIPDEIKFYDLTNIKSPRFIGNYEISSNHFHGMICYEKRADKIELIVFGGQSISFPDSFIKVIVESKVDDYKSITKENFDQKFIIKHEAIQTTIGDTFNKEKTVVISMSNPYCTIVNHLNERILVVLDASRSLIAFNCATNHIMMQENAMAEDSSQYLYRLVSHCDHIHAVGDNHHFIIDSKKLLNSFRFGNLKCLDTFLFWEQERIIWIAFEKNQENEKCVFARKRFPKEIVFHILSLLK